MTTIRICLIAVTLGTIIGLVSQSLTAFVVGSLACCVAESCGYAEGSRQRRARGRHSA